MTTPTPLILSTSVDKMNPAVANERSPENNAPLPSAAVEMGTLQPQPSLGPLELIERDQQIRTNPQQPSHAQTIESRSSPLLSNSSQHDELTKQVPDPSKSQDQSDSRISRHAEAEKPKYDDFQSQVAGSVAGKHAALRAVSPTLPAIRIILLLPTGARHNLHITESYLREQNISVTAKDLFAISIYTLKELILRDWHEEWSVKPTSPAAIRLIHFGRLLDDKQSLNECRFNVNTSNVVHMAVKPQDLVDEDDPKTAKGTHRDRDGDDRTAGCRCSIQ